jgi:peptidyl-prolyl cis-trans isomerase D
MVLQILRKKTRSVFIYAAFAIIIVVFIFYFGWGGIDEKRETWVAKINDQPISRDEYVKHYNQLKNYYERMYKTTFDRDMVENLGIKQEALDNLIKNRLLLETAYGLSLKIPEIELKSAIEGTPIFQNEGRFDVQRYTQMLRQNRIAPEEFEGTLRRDLMGSRISGLVQDGTKYAEKELWEQFVWENEKINLEFLEIDPEEIAPPDNIPTEETKDYYEKHKDEFRVPEKTKISYLEFYPKHFEKQIVVSPEEVSQYYKDFSEEFWEPKKVHARHILRKADQSAPESEKEDAKKKAEEILAMIKEGKPFEELAKEHSQDQGTAVEGGDLGFFARGQMVKPFEEVAFALTPGEVSNVVETRFGFHIIKVDEVKEEGTKPIEAVEEQIRTSLTEERARELVKKEASRAYRMALKSKTLEEYADKNELKIVETDYIAKEEDHPLLGGSEELVETVFSSDSGDILYPHSISESYYVIQIEDKKQSYIPGLEEAEEEIVSILIKQNQKTAAKRKAEDLLQSLKEGNSLEEIAEKENLTTKETKLFSRSSGSIPSIGDNSAMMIAAFRLSLESPYPDEVYEVNEKTYLVKLKEREEVIQEEFTAKEEEQGKKYRLQKSGRYLDDWLDNVRFYSAVITNPEANL